VLIVVVLRCVVAAILLASATACSSAAPTASTPSEALQPQPVVARTAQEVVAELAVKVGTAKPSVVFTAETDPNKLLGRPNGYTSKASFADTRIKSSDMKDTRSGSVDIGGSVEVYTDEAGATARKKFIDETMKATPILGTEYSYVDGPVLLRVSQALTPAQAAEYEKALLTG
jgi:hypothetical protein